MHFLLATRNPHKAREIREILSTRSGLTVETLDEAGVSYEPAEEKIEVFDTFAANALAKARYFARRTGASTLADDSGLVVDALGGAPGVRSRRFAADAGAARAPGESEDEANNRHLLARLANVATPQRTARYVCAATAVLMNGGCYSAIGTWEGRITHEPRGRGGFGYDPLFALADRACTAAELAPDEKRRLGHRGAAFRALGVGL